MSPIALYRKYRPGLLSEVIGQEHITVPLTRAIENNRIHHAYLFTGPRGCGKTSTARILARSLNCEQGPTPTPCGTCDSCVALAPNGPGSMDVIEMDAATHGLVDDARDLREKAMFAPAGSRYKIYILDEAHMLGPGAANALLKLIEEPPPHLRFIFATTESEKILPTIKSRTHQYPFRLVSVATLTQHLAWICEQEQVPADPRALTLIARAGAGSVRDAQSVLGQVLAGADDAGITYEQTVLQLGFTDVALLDRTMTALAQRDAPELFTIVEQVVEAGQEPRRFVNDLLLFTRDLLLVSQVPSALDDALVDVPGEQTERMQDLTQLVSVTQLNFFADLMNQALSELRGATAPRLQLELLMARLLLPAADGGELGLALRVEQLEQQVRDLSQRPAEAITPPASTPPASKGVPSPVATAPQARGVEAAVPPKAAGTASTSSARVQPRRLSDLAPSSDEPQVAPAASAGQMDSTPPAAATPPTRTRSRASYSPIPKDLPPHPDAVAEQRAEQQAAHQSSSEVAPESSPPAVPQVSQQSPQQAAAQPPAAEPAAEPAAAPSGLEIAGVSSMWSAVLAALSQASKATGAAFSNSTPVSLAGTELTVGVANNGVLKYLSTGSHQQMLEQAIAQVLQTQLKTKLVVAGGPAHTAPAATASGTPMSQPAAPTAPSAPSAPSAPPSPAAQAASAIPTAPAAPTGWNASSSAVGATGAEPTSGAAGDFDQLPPPDIPEDMDDPQTSADDEEQLSGLKLLEQELGGVVVDPDELR